MTRSCVDASALRRLIYASSLVLALAACGPDTPSRDASGAVEEAGDLPADRVRVGDCFDAPEREVERLPVVPCEAPHPNEVIAVFDLSGSSWPGQEEVEQLAARGCLERFEPYVGQAYGESALQAFPITPSQESWEDDDDRAVICAAFDPDGPLTGSVKGSGR